MALSMKMQSAQMVAGSRRMAMASPRVARAQLSSRAVSAAPVSVAAAPRTQRASRASRVVVEAIKKSVGDLKKADLEGKRVLVRADLNVPLDKSLNITDDTRIRAAIPTLKYLLDNGAKVLLTSHLVRATVGGRLRTMRTQIVPQVTPSSQARSLASHAGRVAP